MRWAWFGLAVAVLALVVAGGLYAAGPKWQYSYGTHKERECIETVWDASPEIGLPGPKCIRHRSVERRNASPDRRRSNAWEQRGRDR
jgi:hypothetical protein